MTEKIKINLFGLDNVQFIPTRFPVTTTKKAIAHLLYNMASADVIEEILGEVSKKLNVDKWDLIKVFWDTLNDICA